MTTDTLNQMALSVVGGGVWDDRWENRIRPLVGRSVHHAPKTRPTSPLRSFAQYGKDFTQDALQAARSRQFQNMPVPEASNAVVPGLRTEFIGTYMQAYEDTTKLLERLGLIQIVSSDKRYEIYSYSTKAGYPSRQDKNQGPTTRGFSFVNYTVQNYAYALRIPYDLDDIKDDQTGSYMQQVQNGARNFGTLVDRLVMQILQSTTDGNLLPGIPLAPDGVSIYSATDGNGDARFGRTGGNIVSGTSSPNGNDVRNQYYECLAAFTSLLDTQGQPLINPTAINNGVSICYGPLLTRQMQEAFVQAFPAFTDANLASGAAAGMSNVVLDGGKKVELHLDARITSDNFFVTLLNGGGVKPIVLQEREPLYTVPATNETSDFTRDTNIGYDQTRCRLGIAPNLPYQTLLVDNS